MVDGMNATLMEADKPDEIALVGESFYQEALWMAVASNYDRGERVRHPVVVVLYPEPNNPHDRNAISGWIGGLKVGHFSREDAAAFRASVEALMAENGQPIALHGVIAGGGQRSDGPGNLGVWLYYPPERLVRTTG
jgi:collagen type III alpha